MMHIGVLSPVAGGFYFGEVLAGIVSAVAAEGGRVSLVQTRDAGQTGDELIAARSDVVPIGWEHFDGVITITEAASRPLVDALVAAGKPVVLVSNYLGPGTASVMTDNHTGTRSAVRHLIEHGHTRIGFVGNLTQTDMGERYDAYCAELAAHDIPVDPELVFSTVDHVETGGRSAADAVTVALPGMTALVASTDRIALGLMRVLAERGVRLPEELALVGFDDVEDGWRSTPPLATVNQEVGAQGAMAARLILAELRGEPVERRRYTARSTFLPRRSCGCSAGAAAVSAHGTTEAHELLDALAEQLGPEPAGTDRVDLDALDAVIATTLTAAFPTAPAPETLEKFSGTFVPAMIEQITARQAAGLPGVDVLVYCLSQVTVHLAQVSAQAESLRAQRLGSSLVEQYDVGMALLATTDTDPRDLSWLERVSVRLACMGVWDGPPTDRRLRIITVYDPDGQLTAPIDPVCTVQQFPPAALVDQADPAHGEVTFVLPLRGVFGDYGMLCLIGVVDTHAGTGRASYNHWSALLSAALKQRALTEDLRLNEERYALVTAATEDGLWDWDLVARTCYYSERFQAMLGAAEDRVTDPRPDVMERDEALELLPWTLAVHPDDHAGLRTEMLRAVRHLVPIEVEHRIKGPDGEYRWVLCRALPVGEPGSEARRIVGSVSDIHQRKELEEQLRQGALYDTLTGLPNRRLFLDRLTCALEQSSRPDGSSFAVAFLDLDGFKLVNDSLGHLMGDELLRTIAQRLNTGLRAVDTAARFGGDEFAVLLVGLQHEAVLSIVARIQEQIALPLTLADHEVAVTASIGITTSAAGYTNPEDVLRDADIAMYHAKEAGRGTASVFDPAMHSRATGRLQAQSELRTALVEQQFVMHYQPMVDLDGSALTQFEGLVRWEHPERGTLLPEDFLPVMAETGTIVTLGQWIVDAVCDQIARWQASTGEPVVVSVNLSHREFWSEQLVMGVTRSLAQHRVPPHCLVLEITESVIMADPEAAREILADLHAAGVRLHIDDFGTGRSSLTALRSFPVDALKLDRSFVRQLGVDRQTTDLVRIIVEMGRTLGMTVVAEGVETTDQADRLRAMGCETAQGWLYARALPAEQAGDLIGSRLDAGLITAATERDRP